MQIVRIHVLVDVIRLVQLFLEIIQLKLVQLYVLMILIPMQILNNRPVFIIAQLVIIKMIYQILLIKGVQIIVLEIGVIIQQVMEYVLQYVHKIHLYLEILFKDLEYVLRYVVMDYLETNIHLMEDNVQLHVQLDILLKQIL